MTDKLSIPCSRTDIISWHENKFVCIDLIAKSIIGNRLYLIPPGKWLSLTGQQPINTTTLQLFDFL